MFENHGHINVHSPRAGADKMFQKYNSSVKLDICYEFVFFH